MLSSHSRQKNPPPSPYSAAVAAQKQSRDMLAMPPPPPPNKTKKNTRSSAPPTSTLSKPATALSSLPQNATAPSMSLAQSPKVPFKRNHDVSLQSRSPATPRSTKSLGPIHQLSRNLKPKPFHQKLLEAETTPLAPSTSSPSHGLIKSSSSPNLAASKQVSDTPAFKQVSEDTDRNDMEALKAELNAEKIKCKELDAMLQSRNQFISNIEKIAQSTSDKLAINQSLVASHLAETKNYENKLRQTTNENHVLKAKLNAALDLLTPTQRNKILKMKVVDSAREKREKQDELVDEMVRLSL
ncbi:hypothetical protein HDU78_006060 [Chytriomyces hyalinus]|nr:hypothetical protein HDU78_006060 [Chytriomyces hyalinus]